MRFGDAEAAAAILGESMRGHPRCPVSLREGGHGFHVLPAKPVEIARLSIGGAAVKCDRCDVVVYVPPATPRGPFRPFGGFDVVGPIALEDGDRLADDVGQLLGRPWREIR